MYHIHFLKLYVNSIREILILNLKIFVKPYLVASKLEVDVFELAVCRKGGYNVSLADYCYAAIWHKITASWSLAKAARKRHGQIFRL